MIQRINFIPEDLKTKRAKLILPVKYLAVVAVGIVFIILMHLNITNKIKKIDAKKMELDNRKLKLIADNMKFLTLQQDVGALTKALGQL